MKRVKVGIIGTGGVSLANHLPGFASCEHAEVTALCDRNAAVLEKASVDTGIKSCFTAYEELLEKSGVDAVVVATPNVSHARIALAAIAAGKHVLCEKPLAMNYEESLQMYHAARDAGVRHMTAFTYRFVPAMRWMAHQVQKGVVGKPYHFRASRFQDWGTRKLGWRQDSKLAGTGELGDMLSHRIDYGHYMLGPYSRVVADMQRFIDDRDGEPSDLEDWVGLLGRFVTGPTALLESSKVATGRGEGAMSQDYCEVNGSEGSLLYLLDRPHELQRAVKGDKALKVEPVPKEFLAWPGSKRNPFEGDPLITFRYDQDAEFIDAIVNQRECTPSFLDGVRAQAVMDATVLSTKEHRWVDVNYAGT